MAEQVQQPWQPMQTFPDPTRQAGYGYNQNVAGTYMVQSRVKHAFEQWWLLSLCQKYKEKTKQMHKLILCWF